MNLIKQLNKVTQPIVESPTGAGDVAGANMPLFASLVRRTKEVTDSIPSTATSVKPSKRKKGIKLAEAAAILREVRDEVATTELNTVGRGKGPQQGFDTSTVIAKLKGLESKERTDMRDTVTFGLEDDNNATIRVSVPTDQGEEFERTLQAYLQSAETEDRAPDIAEILFNIKDRFDFVDIQWPEVEQDEEQVVDELQPEDGGDIEGGSDQLDPPVPDADTNSAASLLTQVIDMMKADADARKAEARAREAEARTKEADAIVAQTMSRVKQEEQYLDMETHERAKKDEEREAKRLAKLARWKHDLNQSDDTPPIANVENEEANTTPRPRTSPHDIAQFIINRMK